MLLKSIFTFAAIGAVMAVASMQTAPETVDLACTIGSSGGECQPGNGGGSKEGGGTLGVETRIETS